MEHQLLVEVDCAEVSLFELITYLDVFNSLVQILAASAGLECLADAGVVHDVLADELVNRNEQIVVFDGEVGAHSVNIEALLVLHQNHTSREDIS